MKKIISFLLIFCFIAGNSQNKKIDSLFNVLKKAKEDTNKVILLNKFCRELLSKSYNDSALFYANEGKSLAQKLLYKKGISSSCNNIGIAQKNLGNYPEAIRNHTITLKIEEEIHNTKGIISAYSNLGVVYANQGNYPEALKNYLIALKKREEINDKIGIVTSYINIGQLYGRLGNDSAALKNFTASLKINEELGDKKSIGAAYNNIGIVYKEQGKFDEALKNYAAALKIKEEMGDRDGIAGCYSNIGNVYYKQGKYTEAQKNYFAALKIQEAMNDKRGISSTYANIGNVYTLQNKPGKALEYLDKALQLAKQVGSLDQISNNYESHTSADIASGNFKAAFEHYKLFVLYRDSISNKENTKKLVQVQMQYNFDKKETAIKAEQDKKDALAADEIKIKKLQLNRSRYFTYGLSGLVLLILALGFLFFRQNKLQNQQRSLQLEQKLLRSQMNPHFIFNSLAAIESFIYENQPKEAGRYLSDFGRLMRLILENSAEEYVPLQKEIKTLKYYLALQKLRLEEKFTYTIHVDENINTEEVQIPPMLTQPFIENAIEHGLIGNKQEGLLEISFHVREDQLVVEVKDNGVGISKSLQLREPKSKHKSMAIQITKERLKILNRFKKQKLGFLISDISDITKNSTGTKVEFSIPL